MTCEYCGKYIPNQLTECPYCGAANPVYKKLEDEITLTKEKISQSEKELERLKNERDAKKKAAAEADREATEGITMAAICSIVTAFAETVAFTLDRNVNFMIIFIVFYIGNFLGNSFLFAVLSGFNANKIIQLILCAGFMILGCIILK